MNLPNFYENKTKEWIVNEIDFLPKTLMNEDILLYNILYKH
jgi:hypothetical protein